MQWNNLFNIRFICILQVKEKKYETVGTTSQMLAASMRIMAASSVNLQPFRNPIRSTSIMSSLTHRKNSNGSNNAAAQLAAANNANSASTAQNANGRVGHSGHSSHSGSSVVSNSAPKKAETPDAIEEADTEVTTVLLQPPEHCRVRGSNPTTNHVTYSIDTKPKHLIRGSPLWTIWVWLHFVYFKAIKTPFKGQKSKVKGQMIVKVWKFG